MAIGYSKRIYKKKSIEKPSAFQDVSIFFFFTFFFEFAEFGQFWLHGHAELMRDSAQVEQMFRFVIAARVVGELSALRTADGSNFEFLPLKRKRKGINIK